MRITNTVFKVHYRKLVIIVVHKCLRHSHSKCNIAVKAMTFWSSELYTKPNIHVYICIYIYT